MFLVSCCLLTLSFIARAQEDFPSTRFPMKMTMYSRSDLYDYQVRSKNVEGLGPEERQSYVFFKKTMATFTRISATEVHVTLDTPLSFSVYEKEGEFIKGRIVKSFVMNMTPSRAQALMSLKKGSLFAVRDLDYKELKETIRKIKDKGIGDFIRNFLKGEYQGSIAKLKYVNFTLNEEYINLKEGVDVEVVGVRHKLLVSHERINDKNGNLVNNISLDRVAHMVDQKDPVIAEYLKLMKRVIKSIRYFRGLGWLGGVSRRSQSLEGLDRIIDSDPQVIRLQKQSIRCSSLF